MPFIDATTCNNNLGPVAAPSKIILTLGPLQPACMDLYQGEQFTVIMAFNGEEWYGASDGMTASLAYIGVSGGIPVWVGTGMHFECGSGSVSYQSLCPPGPYLGGFNAITPLCW